MIQDLIVIKQKLRILYDEMLAALEHYSGEIDGSHTEQDENFTLEVVQLQHDMDALQERMEETVTSFMVPLGCHKGILPKKVVKPYDLSDFINHQTDLMKVMEQTLHIPLYMNLHLVEGLKELVYQFGYGRHSGLPVKARPNLRFLMIAVSGWMLIKKYGGEFVRMNGLSVRIEDLNCIIMLEDNSNNARFYEWFSQVTIELDALKIGLPIPKDFKGIIQY